MALRSGTLESGFESPILCRVQFLNSSGGSFGNGCPAWSFLPEIVTSGCSAGAVGVVPLGTVEVVLVGTWAVAAIPARSSSAESCPINRRRTAYIPRLRSIPAVWQRASMQASHSAADTIVRRSCRYQRLTPHPPSAAAGIRRARRIDHAAPSANQQLPTTLAAVLMLAMTYTMMAKPMAGEAK